MTLGLKIKPRWLDRILHKRAPFHELKTVEVRRFPPERFCPPGLVPVHEGSLFYLCCEGKIHALVKLSKVEEFQSLTAFQDAANKHHITPETCPQSGPTSYNNMISNFEKGPGGILFGWHLELIKAFSNPPCSGQIFKGKIIPEFYGQKHGQVWIRKQFPKML